MGTDSEKTSVSCNITSISISFTFSKREMGTGPEKFLAVARRIAASPLGRLSSLAFLALPLNRAILRSKRGGSRSSRSGSRACPRRGRRSGSARRRCPSCPRARHVYRPKPVLSDLSPLLSNTLHTNLDTTPKHCHAYHKSPRH